MAIRNENLDPNKFRDSLGTVTQEGAEIGCILRKFLGNSTGGEPIFRGFYLPFYLLALSFG